MMSATLSCRPISANIVGVVTTRADMSATFPTKEFFPANSHTVYRVNITEWFISPLIASLSAVKTSMIWTMATSNWRSLSPVTYFLAVKQRWHSSDPLLFLVSHASTFHTNERRRRRRPIPISSRLTTKEFPHPNGCNSQLCPLPLGKNREEQSFPWGLCIASEDWCMSVHVVPCCVVSFAAFCHNSATLPSCYGDYAYWRVAGGKENPFKTVLVQICDTRKIKMFPKSGRWNLYSSGT